MTHVKAKFSIQKGNTLLQNILICTEIEISKIYLNHVAKSLEVAAQNIQTYKNKMYESSLQAKTQYTSRSTKTRITVEDNHLYSNLKPCVLFTSTQLPHRK